MAPKPGSIDPADIRCVKWRSVRPAEPAERKQADAHHQHDGDHDDRRERPRTELWAIVSREPNQERSDRDPDNHDPEGVWIHEVDPTSHPASDGRFVR